jgi:hypothetical protein
MCDELFGRTAKSKLFSDAVACYAAHAEKIASRKTGGI